MAFDEEGQAVDGRPQGRHLRAGLQAADRGGRLRAVGHHLRLNILTVGTGIEEHNNYAVEFIEAVRELKQMFPEAKTSRRREQRLVLLPRQRRRSARR